jgi:hypothetical protein
METERSFNDKQKQQHKPSKNARIKQSLFKDKRKPKKTEDEEQEVKRLKKIIESNLVG